MAAVYLVIDSGSTVWPESARKAPDKALGFAKFVPLQRILSNAMSVKVDT
jgi:hypothetical protein